MPAKDRIEKSGPLKRRAEDRAEAEETVVLHLRAFSEAVLHGAVPPLEISRFIADRFRRYLDANGALTLDESFDLRSIQRVGSPLSRIGKQAALMSALAEIARIAVSRQLHADQAVFQFMDEVRRETADKRVESGDSIGDSRGRGKPKAHDSSPVTYQGALLEEGVLIEAMEGRRGKGLLRQLRKRTDVKR
ncbi:MAG: hypothetical protein U1F15_15435 [Burkholderiales bacterium]